MELTGKVALVTGGSRGIGAEIARELARGGAQVVVGYQTRSEAAEAVVAEITASGGQAFAVQGDVAIAAGAEALIAAAMSRGAIDILVNNAGIADDRLALQMSDEQFSRVVDTNAGGTFRMCRLAMGHMFRTRHGGAIINLASVSALRGNRGQANYAASKAAILAMTRVMAQEMGRRNIRVNAVAPGFVETEMVAAVDPRVLDEARKQIPLQRLGKPQDIAPIVRFLAGPGAAWITGQCLVVDGGMTA